MPADRQLGREARQARGPSELDEVHVVLSQATRNTRGALGPVAWSVLEDVLLDARHDDQGQLVAVTNVRRVAAHVGIAKDTAARAVARLVDAGLVLRLPRRREASGAFAHSAYELRLSPAIGLALVTAATGPVSSRRAVLDVSAEPVPGPSSAPQAFRRGDRSASGRRRHRASDNDQWSLFELSSECSELR